MESWRICFFQSEETVYIEITGDPVYDTYDDDYAHFIKYKVPQDVVVHEGVHNSNSNNSIQDSALVISMENYALIQANHVVVDSIKSKTQVVTCLVGDWFVETKGSTTMIGYVDKNNLFYICLLIFM